MRIGDIACMSVVGFPARRATVVVALATAVLGACSPGDSTGSGTGPPLPQPKIGITLGAQASVKQGDRVSIAIAIQRTDYTGPVFVTFENLPRGVTAPSVSSTSTNQFNIPLVADSTAPLASSLVRVNATGIDVASVVATFTRTVTTR
jgi:hypothetical protein